MQRPFAIATSLLAYKYDCIEEGTDLTRFHASEDVDSIRSGVYSRIEEHSSECKAYSAKIHKPNLPDKLKDPAKAYSLAFDWLIKEVSRNEVTEEIAKVIVVTDSLPKDAKRRQVEKPLKAFMRRQFQDKGIPYSLLHHKSESDPNLQAADYLCWAVQRHETKGLDWPMSRVESIMASVSEVIINQNAE